MLGPWVRSVGLVPDPNTTINLLLHIIELSFTLFKKSMKILLSSTFSVSNTKNYKILGTVLSYHQKGRVRVAFPINFSVNAPVFEEVCFRNYHLCRRNKFFSHEEQMVTKRCRLAWLTNSALVYEPKCGGRGGFAGSQPVSTAVHRSPNKLWRSNSIFNLWRGEISGVPCSSGVTAKWQARGRSGPIGAQQATAANLKMNTITRFWIL
jgi:hypothetical protein